MFDLDRIIICENSFPSGFADIRETPYGRLYYNETNASSHDSNHALILNLRHDPDEAITDIITFYESKGISPRIYQAYQENERELLRPYFIKYGLTYEELDEIYMILEKPSTIRSLPGLKVKRVLSLDNDVIRLIMSDKSIWTLKVLQRHIAKKHFHFLVGYFQGEPVTMASVNVFDGFSRVDDVLTDPAQRGKGFSSAMIDYLVKYHVAFSSNALYLYTSNPIAYKIYLNAGFVDFPAKLDNWRAWKEK